MTGNPTLDKALLGLNALLIIAGTGLVIYSHTMLKPKPIDEGLEFSQLAQRKNSENTQPAIAFPEMVINLYSPESRLRFANITMNLETYRPEQARDVEKSKALIQDSLIDLVSNMGPEEINSVTGRILLESKLKRQINDDLSKKIVKKIYFSKFIIQ